MLNTPGLHANGNGNNDPNERFDGNVEAEMPEIQIRTKGDSTWQTPSLPVEEQLIINYWKELMPPDMIRWWTICWHTGEVIYYRWARGKPPMVPEDIGPQESL